MPPVCRWGETIQNVGKRFNACFRDTFGDFLYPHNRAIGAFDAIKEFFKIVEIQVLFSGAFRLEQLLLCFSNEPVENFLPFLYGMRGFYRGMSLSSLMLTHGVSGCKINVRMAGIYAYVSQRLQKRGTIKGDN